MTSLKRSYRRGITGLAAAYEFAKAGGRDFAGAAGAAGRVIETRRWKGVVEPGQTVFWRPSGPAGLIHELGLGSEVIDRMIMRA